MLAMKRLMIVFSRKICQAGVLVVSWFSANVYASTADSVGLSKNNIEPSSYFGQILISLMFIVLVIFAGAWLLKRFGRVNGLVSKDMRILGNMAIGQRERILLLQVGKEQLLIGVTSSRISLLHELKEPIEVREVTTPMNSAFAQKLQEAIANRKKPEND